MADYLGIIFNPTQQIRIENCRFLDDSATTINIDWDRVMPVVWTVVGLILALLFW